MRLERLFEVLVIGGAALATSAAAACSDGNGKTASPLGQGGSSTAGTSGSSGSSGSRS